MEVHGEVWAGLRVAPVAASKGEAGAVKVWATQAGARVEESVAVEAAVMGVAGLVAAVRAVGRVAAKVGL